MSSISTNLIDLPSDMIVEISRFIEDDKELITFATLNRKIYNMMINNLMLKECTFLENKLTTLVSSKTTYSMLDGEQTITVRQPTGLLAKPSSLFSGPSLVREAEIAVETPRKSIEEIEAEIKKIKKRLRTLTMRQALRMEQ